ncbi:hypothetical protein GEV33_000322 [Tenebrio molitor]|uniref:Uncharacterized protein n=1 Tax=Tenebrio molitor TaxID=7067 RepID=A0A8J6HXB6_TENMO|nr:hypothetical protein GEV33_000322 [Tenebrio molitor]
MGGHGGGRRGGQFRSEIRESLDDQIAELEQGAHLMLQFLQGHQRLGLLADEIVKRPGRLAELKAVHTRAHRLAALQKYHSFKYIFGNKKENS